MHLPSPPWSTCSPLTSLQTPLADCCRSSNVLLSGGPFLAASAVAPTEACVLSPHPAPCGAEAIRVGWGALLVCVAQTVASTSAIPSVIHVDLYLF